MKRADESAPLVALAGGEGALRALLADFYDRVFDDVMIGFLFRGKSKARLVQKELELVLEHFGAPVRYTGRAIEEAHAPHRIFGGQFDRRTQILRETMADHGLAEEVREAWLAHNESLRRLVTRNRAGECRPE